MMWTRSERIRALTTAIQLVQPHHAASDTPVLAVGDTYKALSKAYNYLAILLTQGLGVIAITGQVKGSSVSVSAITEVDKLPPLSSISFTSNPHMKQHGPALVEVNEIKKSETPLQDLADPTKKCVHLVTKLPETYIWSSPADQEVPLAVHASDLFQALVEYSADRTKGEMFL